MSRNLTAAQHHDRAIRVEALRLAVEANAVAREINPALIVEVATTFEAYLCKGEGEPREYPK